MKPRTPYDLLVMHARNINIKVAANITGNSKLDDIVAVGCTKDRNPNMNSEKAAKIAG